MKTKPDNRLILSAKLLLESLERGTDEGCSQADLVACSDHLR